MKNLFFTAAACLLIAPTFTAPTYDAAPAVLEARDPAAVAGPSDNEKRWAEFDLAKRTQSQQHPSNENY